MIEVRELRPGNLVLRWGQPTKICGTQVLDHTAIVLFWDGIRVDQIGCQEIHPILLTPEWLGKLGFEQGYKNVYSKESSEGVSVDIEPNKNGFQPVTMSPDTWVEFGKPFQYVHQLQNLYLALTGEELNIKP